MIEEMLSSIEHQLAQTRFIASNSRPTIADFCLFASLLNESTQSNEFKEFAIACESSSRPHLAKWIHQLSNLISVSGVLGDGWLTPWGGKSSNANELSEHPSLQYFANAQQQKKGPSKVVPEEKEKQTNKHFVPKEKNPKSVDAGILVPKCEINKNVDWDKLNFFNMPFPNFTNVVEAPAISLEDDFGNRASVESAKRIVKEQWNKYK